jgi:transcription termination/antitermination protein NusG
VPTSAEHTGNTVNWFAIRVKSNREKVTSLGQAGKGYEVFLPEYIRNATSGSARANPLFPGYLFCRFDVNRRLPVLTVPGVVHIVGIGKTPSPVSEDEIGSLRVVMSTSLPINADEVYTVGAKIQFCRGPLVGVTGVVVGSQRKKLIVSITLLQRSVSVEIPQDWVGMSKN